MKYLKKISFLMIMMAVMAVVSKSALAAPYFPTKCNIYKYNNIFSYYWVMDGVNSTSDITKLKTTTPGIADISVKTVDGSVVIDVAPKKAGRTKVAFSAKADGTTTKYTCTFTIKTKVNPFKSLKVGAVDFTKKFGKTSSCSQSLKKTMNGQKIKVSLKKGWKIKTITAWKSNDLTEPYKTVKNGKKVTLYKNTILQFELTDPDGTQAIYYVRYK